MKEVLAGLYGKPDKLYAEGLHIAGERYVLTKVEERSLYARKVGYLLELVPIFTHPGSPRFYDAIWFTLQHQLKSLSLKKIISHREGKVS